MKQLWPHLTPLGSSAPGSLGVYATSTTQEGHEKGYPGPVIPMPGLLMTTARVCEMVLEVKTFSCAGPHLQGNASAELSNKTFYNDGNVLFCCCPIATNHIWLWSTVASETGELI